MIESHETKIDPPKCHNCMHWLYLSNHEGQCRNLGAMAWSSITDARYTCLMHEGIKPYAKPSRSSVE